MYMEKTNGIFEDLPMLQMVFMLLQFDDDHKKMDENQLDRGNYRCFKAYQDFVGDGIAKQIVIKNIADKYNVKDVYIEKFYETILEKSGMIDLQARFEIDEIVKERQLKKAGKEYKKTLFWKLYDMVIDMCINREDVDNYKGFPHDYDHQYDQYVCDIGVIFKASLKKGFLLKSLHEDEWRLYRENCKMMNMKRNELVSLGVRRDVAKEITVIW